jgi:hypothetical protein
MIAGIGAGAFAEETVLLPSSNVEFAGDGPAITSGPQKGYENKRDELHEKWFVDVLGSDWTEYKNGSMHMRAVVTEFTKPVQLAFFTFWDGNRSHHGVGTRCPRSGKLSGTGTFTGYRDSDEFWASDPIHWDRMGGEWRIQLRDGNSLQFKSDSEIKKYYPLKFNLTVVFVKSGSTFSGWENHKIEGVGSIGTAMAGMRIVPKEQRNALNMPDTRQAFSIRGQRVNTQNLYPFARGVYIVRMKQNDNAKLVTKAIYRKSSF